jgi:hypothetical protein
MRRRIAFQLTVLVVAMALPAWAAERHFEGRTEPIDGTPACSGSGMHVAFEVTRDGEVLGGAVTFQAPPGGEVQDGTVIPISSDGFHGTLELNGGLHASFHAGRHADSVTIDGIVSGDRFEGVVQRAGCRYRLILDRR